MKFVYLCIDFQNKLRQVSARKFTRYQMERPKARCDRYTVLTWSSARSIELIIPNSGVLTRAFRNSKSFKKALTNVGEVYTHLYIKVGDTSAIFAKAF